MPCVKMTEGCRIYFSKNIAILFQNTRLCLLFVFSFYFIWTYKLLSLSIFQSGNVYVIRLTEFIKMKTMNEIHYDKSIIYTDIYVLYLDFVLHDLISWLSISQWKRKATEIEQICKLWNENVLFTMSQYIKKNVTFFNVLFSIS